MTLVTVLSASGRPGLAQVRQLKEAGYKVRGTTRNPQRLSQFDDIEIVVFKPKVLWKLLTSMSALALLAE